MTRNAERAREILPPLEFTGSAILEGRQRAEDELRAKIAAALDEAERRGAEAMRGAATKAAEDLRWSDNLPPHWQNGMADARETIVKEVRALDPAAVLAGARP